MKRTTYIRGGVLLGVITFMALLYFGTDTFSKERSEMLSIDEMLLVTTKTGTALVDFINYGKDGAESSYRWRFKPINGFETQGVGSVYEKYERSQILPNTYRLTDKGSQLEVVAGIVTMRWSYGSTDKGWLYVDKVGPSDFSVGFFADYFKLGA
jgi:hypothetical protein